MPFDATSYIMGRNSASGGGGGGGGDITVEPLEVTDNGTYTADEGKAYSPVTVNVPKGGGGDSAPENDVIFIDYDGTITNSYTKDEFLALSAMPENPTHDGLISQGWNWSFADAQEYVSKYGMLVVGQMYITDDGKTRLYIHIADIARNDVPVYFTQTVSNGVTIDWGDGSPTETSTGTGARTDKHHVYAAVGDYVITLDPVDGCELGLGTGANNGQCVMGSGMNNFFYVYSNMLRAVEIGDGVKGVKNYAFNCCTLLEYVSIPKEVTSVDDYAFGTGSQSLRSITIPTQVSLIGANAFRSSGVTNVSLPSKARLSSGESFSGCNRLRFVAIPDVSDILAIRTFNACYSLASIRLTGQTRVGQDSFAYCRGLSKVYISNTVASIATEAFYQDRALAEIWFESATPPTVSGSNAFYGVPTDCKIYVPAGSLSAYTSATNYPNPSTYTYIEY